MREKKLERERRGENGVGDLEELKVRRTWIVGCAFLGRVPELNLAGCNKPEDLRGLPKNSILQNPQADQVRW